MTRPISDSELAGLIQTEIEQSNSWAGSEWRESIKQSLNYLLLRNKGDEVEGRSQIQSGDVADMLDHVHAEMQPMYAVDNIVELGPEGPQDEEAAHAETEALNWYWRERLRGFDELDAAIQDGLLSRNGYLKVWYEESFGLPFVETLEGTQEQIDATLMQLSEDNQVEPLDGSIIQQSSTSAVDVISTDGITPITTLVEVQPTIFSVTVKLTPLHREVKGECIAPEDIFVSKDAVGTNMQKPRFVAHRRRMARMDIKALGFDDREVDQMPQTGTYDTDVKNARKSDHNTYERQGAHVSGQTVDLFEVYYRIDRDGDGIPELWKCFYSSNRQVLNWANGDSSCEMVRVRPFACGSPMKVAHRHEGRSLYDKERQIEDTKRSLIRQMLDNLELGNDSGFVVGPTVNRSDLEQTDAVRYIRAQDVADLQPIPYTRTAEQSLMGLNYMDKLRRERGGSSIEMSTENRPVNEAAHSTERVMSAMERLVAMYARNFARALVRDTFVLLHQQLQLLPGKVSFQTGSKWAETEPRHWIERTRINVTLGESDGAKMRKAGALSQVIQIQREDAQGPFAVLSDLSAAYEARLDLTRNAGLSDPSQYWVDPESPESQQRQAQMAQQAEQERQLAMMQQNALVQAQLQAVQMQEQTKRLTAQLDALEAQRDRINKLTIEMSKIEADTGQDIPFSLVGEPKSAVGGAA